VLEVGGLGAGYGQVQVLWDIGVRVDEREIVALVGANGAGKTTLLRAISGVLRPMGGSVRWDGRELAGMRPERIVQMGIAHVPEGRHLFAGLTVKENLLVGAHHRKDPQVSRDLDWVVELFPRLGERLGQVAGRLSGGEQQMCAIARGLMSRPRLIMIDELSLGLAPNLVETLLDRLREIAGTGMSVLLVEQDVEAALALAARGYVLETGHIVAEGQSEALRTDPRIRRAYLGVA
jgi:ABC-type branched-subunit amino acid transport system ATPase component